MKRFYLTMLIGLLLIGIVSAEESGGVLIGKQNDCIQLPQECASCSYVTLTSIQYPNMSRSYINTAMTKQGSSYNYSFCNTADLGKYTYCGIGDVDGTDTVFCKPFEITSTGAATPTGVPTFLGVLIIIIFGTACFMMFLSGTMNEVAFKIFFLIIALVFLMATLITGYMVLTDSNVTSAISTTTLSLVVVMGMILFIIFVWILIRQTINALDLYNIKHGKSWNVGNGSLVGGYNTRRAY